MLTVWTSMACTAVGIRAEVVPPEGAPSPSSSLPSGGSASSAVSAKAAPAGPAGTGGSGGSGATVVVACPIATGADPPRSAGSKCTCSPEVADPNTTVTGCVSMTTRSTRAPATYMPLLLRLDNTHPAPVDSNTACTREIRGLSN